MSLDLIKYAFIAGEISPTLWGRSDLTKYDLGMAEATNFFVDYRGGLSTRPGTEFVDLVKAFDKDTRFFDFAFSPDLSNTYALLFGDHYVRFIQDGGYVLEDAKPIVAVTQAATGVMTVTAHGFSDGDWIKPAGVGGMTQLNGRTFQIDVLTADTFAIHHATTLDVVNTTGFSPFTGGGTVARIYELATPYPAEDLAGLNFFQYRDTVRLTHTSYPINNLVRNDHTSWSISEEDIGVTIEPPLIVSDDVATGGDSEVVFAVTSVAQDKTESVRSGTYKVLGTNNYTTEAGGVAIAWTAVSDAAYYNVYRSVISASADGHGLLLDNGTELGYVGRAYGVSFCDPNIVPDFTKKPPTNLNPFRPGVIDWIEVTAQGTGYVAETAAVTLTTSTGSGFRGEAVVNDGKIVSVIVLDHGHAYADSDTVNFTGGSGATAVLHLRSTSGAYPRCSGVFQQRQIYAATDSNPLTVWGSQPKLFKNFNSSDLVLDNDSFEFELDSPSIAPIRHMLVTRGGLLLLTQESAWLLSGGTNNAALTPRNALAEPQGYTGISSLKPIPIGSDLLFVEGKGFAVRLLAYNEISHVYSGEDRSILSNHLFGEDRQIVSWAYQESPFKVVWGVKSDGRLVSFTTVKDEDVYAWTSGETKGFFKDVVNIREGTRDSVYFVVQRKIGTQLVKFVERLADRTFEQVEDAWCVDCGLTNARTSRGVGLFITEGETTATLTAAGAFSSADAGAVVRGAGGRYKITSFTNTSTVTATIQAPATVRMPQDPAGYIPLVGVDDWSIAQPQKTFGGLWHLEGQTVTILGDGNVFPQQVVTNGQIVLADAVSQLIVGLPFTARARSLPMTMPQQTIEAKRSRVMGVSCRFDKSRGLKIGYDLNNLYEPKERTNEGYGQPIALFDGVRYMSLSTDWLVGSQTYFVQEDPLPVTLLGFVMDVEFGDDPN